MPKSVTYVSGINCHPSIRKGNKGRSSAATRQFLMGDQAALRLSNRPNFTEERLSQHHTRFISEARESPLRAASIYGARLKWRKRLMLI